MLAKQGNVTLAVDIMYINEIPFVMKTSQAIHFGTAELIKNEKIWTIMIAIKQVIEAYKARGFQIHHILANGQFEHARKHIEQMGIILNITSRDEHVPEIERYTRMVKERVWAIVNTLPFEHYPNRLIVKTVNNAVFWINCFPHKDRIHPTLSPRTIVTGSTIDYNKHCTLQFGTYVQVHEPHNNSPLPRTTGAIAIQPSGNMQGRHYFMSLTSGKRIIRNKWTILPMPAEVIATVHQLAAACKKYKCIVFTDKDGNIINDDSNNDSNEDDNNTLEITGVDNTLEFTGVDTTNNDDTTTGVDTNNDDTTTGVDTTNDVMNTNNNTLDVYDNMEDTETATETQVNNIEHNIAPYTESEPNDTGYNQDKNYEQYDDDISIEDKALEDIHITINDINTTHEMNAGQLYVDPNTGEAMEEETDMPTHRYNLWPRPTKRNQKYNMVSIRQQSTIAKPHLHVKLNQVGIREGLKRFGEKGNNALLKELNQLHKRDALLPKKKEDMTYDERKRALRYLMFLKEKRRWDN